MRIDKGKLIKNPLAVIDKAPDHEKYIFIPDGVDYRYRIGDDDKVTGLLRKVEFSSQDEMIQCSRELPESIVEMAKLQDKRIGQAFEDEGYSKSDAQHHADNYRLGKIKYFDAAFTTDEDDENYANYDASWTFGKSEEADKVAKVDRLLEMGKCTKEVRKAIKKAQKQVKLAGLDSELAENFVSCKRKRRFTDEAGQVDVERAICLDDRPFVITKREGKKRTIRIVVNLSASFGNTISTFAKTIALAYVTAEALEKLGYGVEIKGIQSVSPDSYHGIGKDEIAQSFPLKRVEEQVDIERIGSVGLTSISRWYGFRNTNRFFGCGSSQCLPTSQDMRDFLNVDIFVSTSWTKGEASEQATTVVKSIKKALK